MSFQIILGQAGTIDLAATFAEGILSFASPCVLPLVPGYLSFISGVSVSQAAHQAETGKPTSNWADIRHVMATTSFFILGFTTVFLIIFGLVLFVTDIFGTDIKILIQVVAGIAVIIMGLHFLGVFRLGFLNMERRFHLDDKTKPAGFFGAFMVGAAFAGGWTPCVGPFLGAALTKALDANTVVSGMGLMIIYCLGLGIPFLLAGLFMNRLLGFIAKIKRHFRTIEIASGLLLVMIGILIVTNNMSEITRTLSVYRF